MLKVFEENQGRSEILQEDEICRAKNPATYVHPAQEEEEQPPHPEPDDEEDESLEPLPRPNFDSRFSVFPDPHFGQTTSGFEPNTSFSKHSLQAQH